MCDKLSLDKDDLESLRLEIDVMHRLDHRNVARLHEVIDTPETTYLVRDLSRDGDGGLPRHPPNNLLFCPTSPPLPCSCRWHGPYPPAVTSCVRDAGVGSTPAVVPLLTRARLFFPP